MEKLGLHGKNIYIRIYDDYNQSGDCIQMNRSHYFRFVFYTLGTELDALHTLS